MAADDDNQGAMRPRVSVYVATLSGLAIAGAAAVATHGPPSAALVPFWLLLAMAIIGELLTTTVHVRGELIQITLSGFPVVFGLSFADRHDFLLAMAIGVVVSQVVRGVRSPIKFSFNIVSLLCDTVVAILVFDAISATGSSDVIRWVATLAALSASSVSSAIAVTGVIYLATSHFTLSISALAHSLLVIGGSGSMALAAATVYDLNESATVLFIVPVGLVYLGFVAFERQRVAKERIEFLYTVNQIWTDGSPIDQQLQRYLTSCVGGLLAFDGEIIVFSSDTGAFRYTARSDDDEYTLLTTVPDDAPIVNAAMRVLEEATIAHWNDEGPLGSVLGARGIQSGIVAPLVDHSGQPYGLVIFGDRNAAESWTSNDVQLVRTLAETLSPVVASEEQSSMIAQLRTLQDELHFQANHDHLTGLANRAQFVCALDQALETELEVAVVYLDLDGFKLVNDTLGHGAGDRLLDGVADRLRDVIRADDLVARLGGDEFAVLMRAPVSVPPAEELAARVIASLSRPFAVSDQDVSVGASVGVALRERADDASSLIRRADAAMYEAKRSGRNQFCLATQSV